MGYSLDTLPLSVRGYFQFVASEIRQRRRIRRQARRMYEPGRAAMEIREKIDREGAACRTWRDIRRNAPADAPVRNLLREALAA